MTDVLEGTFETSHSLKTAFAAGSSIAPTSLGVTGRLLAEVGELETPGGQLVSIAAVFDDVISLVLLSQVIALPAKNLGLGAWYSRSSFPLSLLSGLSFLRSCCPVWFRLASRLFASLGNCALALGSVC